MDTLQQFNLFVNEILKSNSRLYKASILEKYKDDNNIKYYLNFLYNPYIVTGISDKKLNKEVTYSLWDLSVDNISTVFELLEYLKLHNTGSDHDIRVISDFKLDQQAFSKELLSLLDKIITKNLPLGIDAKSINKMIPDLIPTFNVQLANKYFDKPEIVDGKEFILTTKIDGGRIIAIKENGIVNFYTRAGQKYEGLVDLEQELLKIPNDNFCLDGEITLLDKGNLTSKDQYKQTMMITRKDGIKHGVKMLVFDIMTSAEFKNQKCLTPYLKRRENLNTFFTQTLKYFELLPVLYRGTDTTKITEWLNYNISKGEEGVMINITNAPYEFKRTNSLLKVKKMNDLDLEVIGFEEGTNRHLGRLGALLVDYKGNTVKVGSGFTDELRTLIWEHQEEWLGRTVVIQYFEETKNQNGGISLRFPVYLDYRLDK